MLVIEGISKKYGKKNVLDKVSFEAEKGSCIGILGCNGSGKSTLFGILAGVFKGDAGRFLYKGCDLIGNIRVRSSVLGYVPQNTPLIEELTAIDNLRLWYPEDKLRKELSSGVLDMLGIGEFLKLPVYKMSGGMKKRLAIGCAVANNPEILLLDEPSAALDLVCKEKISDYLKLFKAKGGIILLATHDIMEIPLCDKLYILKSGKINSYEYDGDIKRLAGSL